MKNEMPGIYDTLEASIKEIPRQLGLDPKAILMISGHWEEKEFTVMASPKPPMIYDYGGFPEHTYHIQYPAPGSPDLAKRVQLLLMAAGHQVRLDLTRGFDHGAFTPLAPMYPKADVPVVQLSLRQDYDPTVHLEIGKVLAVLRSEGVLILGSGLSYHNLGNFGRGGAAPSKEFDLWLQQILIGKTGRERAAALIDWTKAPSARLAHPREDHLVPLMVAVGAAHDELATAIYHESEFMGGLTVSSFRFGGCSS